MAISSKLLRRILFLAVFWAIFSAPVRAQIFNSYPFILQNGTTADASQVMADFNQIANQVNANAANGPLNTNISSLSGLINGTVSVPTISWFSFPTTGLYYDTVNGCVAHTHAGVEVGCWNAGGIHLLPVQVTPAVRDAATVGYVNSQIGSLQVAGRLTLVSGTPVMNATVASAGTVYFTPYLGNAMVYSNGSSIAVTTLSEVSQALNDTLLSPAAAAANKVYDMFYWFFTSTSFTGVTTNGFPQIASVGGISGGSAALIVGAAVTGPCIPASTTILSIDTPTQITLNNNTTCNGSGTFQTNQSQNKTFVISRGPAWSTSTSRGYTLTRLGGFYVNTSTIANGPAALSGIYVGTISTDSGTATASWVYGSSAAGGGQSSFQVWNMYNRVPVGTTIFDGAASWTYNVATWREARGDSGFAAAWVCGLGEDSFTASYQSKGANGGGNGDVGIGFNGTTVPLTIAAVGGPVSSGTAVLSSTSGIGVQFVAALEISEAGTTTFTGQASSALNWQFRM